MRTPIDKLAWLLAASDNSSERELLRVTLRNLCRTLDASAATICLLDGTALMLDARVSVRKKDDIRITYAPRTDGLPCCSQDETCIGRRNCDDRLVCPLGKCPDTVEFSNQACIALRLGSTLVGRLLALDESPREFSVSELEYITAKGKQLILRLHHSFYFPEVCSELVALETSMNGTDKESVTDHMHLSYDSMAYQVLSLAKLTHVSSVAALTHSLPKGINWPTLRRICQYLDHSHTPVSRRDLSATIGVSVVTVGHYLKYLTDIGLVQREMAYGGIGRPTIMYRVAKRNNAGEFPLG